MPRHLTVILLLALGACSRTPTERYAIWFEPADPYWTDGVLVFGVGSRGVNGVDGFVDGELRGPWESGPSSSVRLDLDPGEHRLEARASGSTGPLSATATVSVQPFSIVSITPPPGKVPLGTSPEFTARFSIPVSLRSIEASRLQGYSPVTTLANLPHELVDDRTIRFQIPWTFASNGTVSVSLVAAPRNGEPRTMGNFSWSLLAANISFQEVKLPVPPCAGVHRWTVLADGDGPPGGTVTCGPMVLADLSGPAPWTMDVDLDALPEGACVLGFESPGTLITVLQNFPGPYYPYIKIDRTPPRFVSLSARSATQFAGQLRGDPTISLTFSEYVNGDPSVTFNGVVVSAPGSPGPGPDPILEVQVPTHGDLGPIAIGPGTLQDACLNPVEPFNEVLELKRWFGPFGDGPLLGGAKVAAGAAWLEDNPLKATPYGEVPDGYVAWIPAPGEPSAGSLQVSVVSSGNTYRSQLSSGAVVSAFDMSDAVIAWREPTSAVTVKLAFWRMIDDSWFFPDAPQAGTGSEAPVVQFSWHQGTYVGSLAHDGGDVQLAWTEADLSGARAGMLARGTTASMAVQALPLTPAASTLQSFRFVDCGVLGVTMAWLQEDGGVLRVHAIGYNATTAFDGPIDLAGSSSSLSMTCDRAVWSEAGQVYFSTLNPDGNGWGTPVQVLLPMGATADSPALFLGTVSMVVRKPEADEIRVVYIAPDGTQEIWPEVVNQGVPGRVRTVTTSGPTISWIDDAGQLWARTVNLY